MYFNGPGFGLVYHVLGLRLMSLALALRAKSLASVTVSLTPTLPITIIVKRREHSCHDSCRCVE